MRNNTKNDANPRPSDITGKGVLSLALNASYLFTGRWVTIVSRFIYAIILTRYLGPEMYGYLNYGMSWYVLFFPIASFSLGVLLGREVGHNRKKGGEVLNKILALRLFFSLAAALLCGAIGLFIEEKEMLKTLLFIFSFALIGRSLWFYASAAFTAYEMSSQSMRLQAVFRPLEVIAGLVVLVCGGGIIWVAVIHGLSWWLQAIRGFFLVHRRIHPIRLDWKGPIIKYAILGLPISIGNVLNMWLLNGPVVMYKYVIGAGEDLGQFALAMQFFMLLSNLLTVMFMASLPLVSRSVSREDGKDVYFIDAMVRFGILFGALAGITALGAGTGLVQIFFGSKFHDAGTLLGYVLWFLVPAICGNAIWSVYIARGRYVLPMISKAVGVFIFIAIFPWLTETMNTIGAVVSAGIGLMCSAVLLITLFVKDTGLNIKRVIIHPIVTVAIAWGLYVVLNAMGLSAWVSLPVSYMGFLVCIFLFGLITPFERNALLSIIKKRSG